MQHIRPTSTLLGLGFLHPIANANELSVDVLERGDDAVLEDPMLLANSSKAVKLMVHSHAVDFAFRSILSWEKSARGAIFDVDVATSGLGERIRFNKVVRRKIMTKSDG